MTSVASRPPLIAWGFGHKGATTYGLQQDDGDSDMRGRGEAVHSRDAHMACVNQPVTHAITMHGSAACTCAACRWRAVLGLVR